MHRAQVAVKLADIRFPEGSREVPSVVWVRGQSCIRVYVPSQPWLGGGGGNRYVSMYGWGWGGAGNPRGARDLCPDERRPRQGRAQKVAQGGFENEKDLIVSGK